MLGHTVGRAEALSTQAWLGGGRQTPDCPGEGLAAQWLQTEKGGARVLLLLFGGQELCSPEVTLSAPGKGETKPPVCS